MCMTRLNMKKKVNQTKSVAYFTKLANLPSHAKLLLSRPPANLHRLGENMIISFSKYIFQIRSFERWC